MAKGKGEVRTSEQKAQGSTSQGSEKQKGRNGILFTLLALVTAIVIMAAVLGGAFYIVVHNNINGIGEAYRPQINKIPILRMALPKAEDPDDPKNLTEGELKDKYNELRKIRTQLTEQLEQASKKIDELNSFKADTEKNQAELERKKADLEAQAAAIEAKNKEMLAVEKSLNEMIAAGDKEGFRQYFEQVNKEQAAQIYAELVKEQKLDEDTKKFAQRYESMDAKAAAEIFEKMGSSKLELIAKTLHAMKKEAAAEIMAAMTPEFAAKVTEKLHKIFTGAQAQ